MRIFLIGYMGVGKTTLGRKIAQRLNLNFFDLDYYIEKKHKADISYIFNLVGNDGFRLVEHRTLLELINISQNCLISTGGGTPCYHNNIDILNKNGMSFYLKMPINSLVNRLKKAKKKRPLINLLSEKELYGFVEKQLLEREVFYTQANIELDVNILKLNEITEIIKQKANL